MGQSKTYEYKLDYRIYNTKGRLAWQYNPFRNYRLSLPRYKVVLTIDGNEYNQYYNIANSGLPNKLKLDVLYKIYKDEKYNQYHDEETNLFDGIDNKVFEDYKEYEHKSLEEKQAYCATINLDKPFEDYAFTDKKHLNLVYQAKYQLVDFDTNELKFSITLPVNIIALPSYDGSVNLILNDGLNIPRLINSRFSATGNDTYEIVDRKGNDDTNIYDEGVQFDIDTSLYKLLDKIPKIIFKGTQTGGALPVGNYHFYFKLMDADGNESDFIGQSHLVSVFIGTGTKSVQTGLRNLNSHKLVKFQITNIDSAYPYVSIYYSRATAESTEQMVVEYKLIFKKFLITNAGTSTIVITGFEDTKPSSVLDINLTYNIVDKVKTHALNSNRLFLGNVHKTDIPYDTLTNLSLQFCATVSAEPYDCKLDKNYTLQGNGKGYFDSMNIYNKVGYWPNEYYRFGVVYIMKSGELSPVFNIRGAMNILDAANTNYSYIPVYEKNTDDIHVINYSESSYLITDALAVATAEHESKRAHSENVKGVVKLHRVLDQDDYNIIGIKISLPEHKEEHDGKAVPQSELILNELGKYVKGFFFVRQKRMPTILCLGLAIGTDKNSYLPVLPLNNNTGVMKSALSNAKKNHIVYNYNDTDESQSINYVTEGFLSRYTFKFKKKKSGIWGKLGSIALIAVGVAALAVATVFTAGAAGLLGAAIATAITSASLAAVVVAVGAAFVLVAAPLLTASLIATVAIGVMQEITLAVKQITASKTFNGWETEAPSGYKIVEDDSKSRKLGGTFASRLIVKSPNQVKVNALLCPDYSVDQPYYNQVLVGDTHTLIPTTVLPRYLYFSNLNNRHFYIDQYHTEGKSEQEAGVLGKYETTTGRVIGVPSNVSIVGVGDVKFRSKAGEAEEAFRFQAVGDEYKKASPTESDSEDDIDKEIENEQINSDIVRGVFCSYLGTDQELGALYIYDIMTANYAESNTQQYMLVRAEDNSEFFSISDRFDITDFITPEDGIENTYSTFSKVIYSGDCYICQFTLRLLRNFNSPGLPYNDKIIDEDTWRNNYDNYDREKMALINLGDVNAVELGIWVTFKFRSNRNLNIRTTDGSFVDEVALSGHSRGYFPIHPMSTEGAYKLAESEVYNKGFLVSVGNQYHYELPDVPWIKNWFGTRIMYSDIHVNDAFKNGYRIFRPTNYRDYTREYGTITKLISAGTYLIAVMEHGILRLAVNSNNVTTDSEINYNNVLPLNPEVISKDYGSEWQDSIIQTPSGIYGVDTHAKKIWRTDGETIDLLSENVMQRFLNENLKLKEREKTPILGRRNVKTIYNLFKGDIMFTFYNINDYDEIAWNLCYNEKMKKFVTFYSWIPSFMENINNIPFSFDRETSRMFSVLYDEDALVKATNPIYTIGADNKVTDLKVNYWNGYKAEMEVDVKQRFGRYFELKENSLYLKEALPCKGIINVPIKLTVSVPYIKLHPESPLSAEDKYVKTEYNLIVPIVDEETYNQCSVEFWVHGQSGIIDQKGLIKPTCWYGRLHPFEFEFVVADNLLYQKIFDNLQIIANKAQPESFHYEIVGDCYDFSKDKLNMYYRLEQLKHLYNYNGSDISYNSDYVDLLPRLQLNVKSADFPKIYYSRLDKVNQVDHDYGSQTNFHGDYHYQEDIDKQGFTIRNIVYDSKKGRMPSYDYDHLGGAEIVYYKLEDEFRVWLHAKAVNLDNLSQETAISTVRANCKYLEDKWLVTINPLIICYKNEKWNTRTLSDKTIVSEPPMAIYNQPFPDDMKTTYIPDDIETTVDEENWLDSVNIQGTNFGEAQNRKEANLRGRYIKIRIRYSGKELAIIDFINTIYRISYA